VPGERRKGNLTSCFARSRGKIKENGKLLAGDSESTEAYISFAGREIIAGKKEPRGRERGLSSAGPTERKKEEGRPGIKSVRKKKN